MFHGSWNRSFREMSAWTNLKWLLHLIPEGMQYSNIFQWLLVLNLLSRHDPCQGTYVAILALPHDPVFMLCHNPDPQSGRNKCFNTTYPQLRSTHFVIRVASITNFSSAVVADLGCSSLPSAFVPLKSCAGAHSSNHVHGFQAEVQSMALQLPHNFRPHKVVICS